jgi:hypothetical protein
MKRTVFAVVLLMLACDLSAKPKTKYHRPDGPSVVEGPKKWDGTYVLWDVGKGELCPLADPVGKKVKFKDRWGNRLQHYQVEPGTTKLVVRDGKFSFPLVVDDPRGPSHAMGKSSGVTLTLGKLALSIAADGTIDQTVQLDVPRDNDDRLEDVKALKSMHVTGTASVKEVDASDDHWFDDGHGPSYTGNGFGRQIWFKMPTGEDQCSVTFFDTDYTEADENVAQAQMDATARAHRHSAGGGCLNNSECRSGVCVRPTSDTGVCK